MGRPPVEPNPPLQESDPAIPEVDLVTPTGVRAVLAALGLRLHPSRGQHFLVNRHVLDRIIAASEAGPHDTILEVGPGIGTLTVALARTGAAVVAVEVDRRFIPALLAACRAYPRVRIVRADAMELTAAELRAFNPSKVVANLPYSIASPLLINLLRAGAGRRMVVMVQKEVAERIVAPPGGKAYGLLSVVVQAHAVPFQVATVPRTAFFPPPRVASSVLRLEVRAESAAPPEAMPCFMDVVRAAFGQRRKMLRSALQAAGGGLSPAEVEEACGSAGIDPRRRGESLSVEEFAHLAAAFRDREPRSARLRTPGTER